MVGSAIKPLGWRDVVAASVLALLALWATDALPTQAADVRITAEAARPS